MRIITWARIREFIQRHPDAASQLRAWRTQMERSALSNTAELKALFPYVSVINHRRAVFNIRGNRYRLVVDMRYDLGRLYVRGVFTHEEYDRVDIAEI